MSSEDCLSREDADKLVLEFKGWAESIARSVAKGWNLDWQSDGLDGAAMEALIFCSRRFNPNMGVPFKSYARKRIHESATEAARKTKSWTKESVATKRTERLARAVSADLFNLFPQLRSGVIPGEDDSEKGVRVGIQQLLMSACLVSTKHGVQNASPEEATEFKQLLSDLAALEPIHQQLMWMSYWEGYSLRGIADEWETDELNVIREHKVLLAYLQTIVSSGKAIDPPRVRPGLQDASLTQKNNDRYGIFTKQIEEAQNG